MERENQDSYGLGKGVYPVDKVPLDHPNGLCALLPYIPQSMEEIGEKLRNWVDGESNSRLDGWLLGFKKDLNLSNIDNDVIINNNIKKLNFSEMENFKGKLDNKLVREWYIYHDSLIPSLIDKSKTLEEQARQACELRLTYRTQARELMGDKKAK